MRPADSSGQITINPARLPRIGTVDERFLSYNIEMVEVTGGRFWKPYAAVDTDVPAIEQQGAAPAGMDPGLYRYRPPIDLTTLRLRALAAALGPAYVRVSGTWANTVYFHDSDSPAPDAPPDGFGSVLTREQWRGVVDFARTVEAGIVTSFATGAGVRDTAGNWQPDQAEALLSYTHASGGRIAAAEFMNELTYAAMGGAPEGYDAAAYGRDIAAFLPFIRQAAPGMTLLGPGSVGEGGALAITLDGGMLATEDLLAATGPVFDAFSFHFYGATSKRCASLGPETQVAEEDTLSAEWLTSVEGVTDFYAGLRDRFLPGAPLWNTETADAACGGNPWGATFLDSFRFVVQLGAAARRGVQVVIHNTLAASDYGLLEEDGFAPRPNYWAALLWRRLMGTTVLDPGPSPAPNLHLIAHSLRGQSGVAMVAVNTDRAGPRTITLNVPADRYTLTASELTGKRLLLNGTELALGPGDALPELSSVPTSSGLLELPPASITFLAIPEHR